MLKRRPLWRNTQRCVPEWRQLGATDYQCRSIQFGTFKAPTTPFCQGHGEWMPNIPQSAEDQAFAEKDLDDGCSSGIYEEISREQARRAWEEGAVVSSSFVVWKEREEGPKGRFVVNLSRQSKHWPNGSIRMEGLAEFALHVQRGDHFLSMDIEKGYRHFRLHPGMRKWFVFHYHGRFYQCVALPFGWGRSPLWFTQLLSPFVRELRKSGYHVLAYLDDFLIAPTHFRTTACPAACAVARAHLERVMTVLGLSRHPWKGEWVGSQVVEHLGVVVDSQDMRFYVTDFKAQKVRGLATKLLRQVVMGRRLVSADLLASFCGTCVSLSLAMPSARFSTRAIYWDIRGTRDRDHRGRVRLSHQSVRDLKFWQRLSRKDLAGRPIVPTSPTATMHTDASDMGFGGTLNLEDLTDGAPGLWTAQGVWSWKDRVSSINLRELKAIRDLEMQYFTVRSDSMTKIPRCPTFGH